MESVHHRLCRISFRANFDSQRVGIRQLMTQMVSEVVHVDRLREIANAHPVTKVRTLHWRRTADKNQLTAIMQPNVVENHNWQEYQGKREGEARHQ